MNNTLEDQAREFLGESLKLNLAFSGEDLVRLLAMFARRAASAAPERK